MADWTGEPAAVAVTPAAPPATDHARAGGARRCPTSRRPTSPTASSGLARRDDDYYAALVMNNALGQYALGGRLGDSIRERQGMAYYVFSSLDAGLAAGPLMVRAGVSGRQRAAHHRLDRRGAARRARRRASPRAEVDDSKKYLIGSLPRQLETNAGIAGFLLSAELFGLGMDHDVRLPALHRRGDPRRRRARGAAPARSGAGGRGGGRAVDRSTRA